MGHEHTRRTRRNAQPEAKQSVAKTQLMIGRANDPAEHRADRFAATVMTTMGTMSAMSRSSLGDGADDAGRVRRAASPRAASANHQASADRSSRVHRFAHSGADPLGGTALDQQTSSRIARASGGVALPGEIRRAAEQASGRDLGAVRVHSGAVAVDLNERVQASAFTVGRDIFLGGNSARPGSAAGNQLLAHELGHVVESGGGATDRGGTGGRVQRRADLRPLADHGAPTVQRFFNAGKKKRQKAEQKQAENAAAVRAQAEQEAENHPQFASLKSAVTTIERKVAELKANPLTLATEGPLIVKMSRDFSKNFEGAEQDPGFGPLKRKLRYAADSVQEMLDHASVADAKRKAGEIYMNDGKQGNLKALSNHMRGEEFRGSAGDNSRADSRRAAGVALGLTKEEQTAITVFTAQDYQYINPAAANSRSWLTHNLNQGTKPLPRAAEKQALRERILTDHMEEGAMHTGFAMQAFAKMPVWTGPTYRGETFTEADFKKKFKMGGRGSVTARDKTITRAAMSSASKSRNVADSFILNSSDKLGLDDPRKEAFCVLWEFQLTNGRDIEALSANGHEKEIATMPGATFKIKKVSPLDVAGRAQLAGFENIWVVTAIQVK